MLYYERVRFRHNGILRKIIRFVQDYSEEIPGFLLRYSMNVVCLLFLRWEPSDGNASEWVGYLYELLNHKTDDMVVDLTIQSLRCLFDRLILYGYDLNYIVRSDLVECLSRHFSIMSRKLCDIHKVDLPFCYSPSLVEMSKFFSQKEEESQGKHKLHQQYQRLIPVFFQQIV